jgi:hypothetical protein
MQRPCDIIKSPKKEEHIMKKILCTLLALMLLVGCIFTLVSCDTEKDKKEDNKKDEQAEGDKSEDDKIEDDNEIFIPEGYELYSNGAISFAYPKGWTKQDAAVVLLIGDNGNNITVSWEAKSDLYENMTLDTFNTTLKPVYEAMGITVSNVKIEKKETNGLKVLQISHNTTNNSVSMKQTQYTVAQGDKNYTVTVTEVVSDVELVTTVFNTLQAVD